MTDEEDSTIPFAISWRAILKGTGALPSGKKTGAPSDPALRLWWSWQANHSQVVALTLRWQRIETHLVHSVGFPRVEIRLSGEKEPKIAYSLDEIERLLAGAPDDEKRAQVATFVERKKRWDEAAAALGLDAVDAELEAALDEQRRLTASAPTTRAASLPGVAAKLAMIIRLG